VIFVFFLSAVTRPFLREIKCVQSVHLTGK